MRKAIFFVLFGSLAWLTIWSCKQKKEPPEKHTERILLSQVDSFSVELNKIKYYLKSPVVDSKHLQNLFLASRLAYKKFEWAAEYYTPTVTRLVNGPPVVEIEAGGQHVINPEGLQVIEALIFPQYNSGQKNRLEQQMQLLQTNCSQYKAYFQHIDIYNWQIFDAGKLEVFRIITLGITGFDNPLSLNSSRECEASLGGLQSLFTDYMDDKTPQSLPEFRSAINYLHQHTDFNSLNRAEFIATYGNPMGIALTRLRIQLRIPVVHYNGLLNQEVPTLFDPHAFNADALAPGDAYRTTAERIALGQKLFTDPQLSGTRTRSCSSCHQPDKAFTDGLVKNTVIERTGSVKRNTPTLINAALQTTQFYDQRVNTLEDQVRDVLQNKPEMHGDLKKTAIQLWKDRAYQRMFAAAYPTATGRIAIDTFEVMNALGAYVRSLILLNSRFDDYMRGNKTAMNASEVNGFNLFMGKARCGTCHYMPLFNGTLPPAYTKMDAEVIGVPAKKSAQIIDADKGRFDVLQFPSLKYAFKTPTVRNAAKTAPYMHNGVFINLGEVIDFYNKGGGAGTGLKIDNQTLSAGKLDLTAKETGDLIAFIKTLDSN